MFLREKEFKFLESLRERFLRKAPQIEKEARESKKIKAERPVEQRFLTKACDDMVRFEYESSPVIEWTWESLYWSWRRVGEYYRQMTEVERYEQLVEEIKI